MRTRTVPVGKRRIRARLARRLFELAVAADRRETWRVVWEGLEARRGPYGGESR